VCVCACVRVYVYLCASHVKCTVAGKLIGLHVCERESVRDRACVRVFVSLYVCMACELHSCNCEVADETGVHVCVRVIECVCLCASVSMYAMKSTVADEFTSVCEREREREGERGRERERECVCVCLCVSVRIAREMHSCRRSHRCACVREREHVCERVSACMSLSLSLHGM